MTLQGAALGADDLAVVLTYAGGLALLIGGLSMARPLSFMGVRTRQGGTAVAGAGLLLVAAACAIGGERTRPVAGGTQIDEFMPEYHFHELHSIRVHARRDRVYAAIKAVTADEIRFFRTLTWLRSPSLVRRAESILAPSRQAPLLAVATRTGFLLLAEDAARELVVGTVMGGRLKLTRRPEPRDFVAFDRPGYCKVATNFLIDEEGADSCRLSTETRVLATDESARRKFALYWRVIYPGSALIRREWLKAIRRRAEALS